MSETLASAVYAFASWINDFAEINYPGTNIPIAIIMLSPLAVIVVWRYILKKIFGAND